MGAHIETLRKEPELLVNNGYVVRIKNKKNTTDLLVVQIQ